MRLAEQRAGDALNGGAGDDDLKGGLQKDSLTGGAGADDFVFDDGDTAATRALADLVGDFSRAGGDELHLRQVDADAATGGDQNFSFIGTAAFGGVAGQLRYEVVGGDAYLHGDTDGNGLADLVIRVNGVASLAAVDFVL